VGSMHTNFQAYSFTGIGGRGVDWRKDGRHAIFAANDNEISKSFLTSLSGDNFININLNKLLLKNNSNISGRQGGKVVGIWISIPATRVRLPPRSLPQKKIN